MKANLDRILMNFAAFFLQQVVLGALQVLSPFLWTTFTGLRSSAAGDSCAYHFRTQIPVHNKQR